MPKFDPFSSSIVNAEQEKAFQDKFVDDGKSEGNSARPEKNASVSTSTSSASSARTSRFSRFSSNKATSQEQDDDVFSEQETVSNTSSASAPTKAIVETKEAPSPQVVNTTSNTATGTSRFSRFSTKNNSNKEPVTQVSEPQDVKAVVKTIETPPTVSTPIHQDSQINTSTNESNQETKLTGRARFAIGRNKVNALQEETVSVKPVNVVNDNQVESTTETIIEEKVVAPQPQPTQTVFATEEVQATEQTDVSTSTQVKSTRFSFRKQKEVEVSNTNNEVVTQASEVKEEAANVVQEKVQKAPWEDDEIEATTTTNQDLTQTNVVNEDIIESKEEEVLIPVIEEPKKKFSIKKKSNLEVVETKKIEGSLDNATQSSDSLTTSIESVEKKSHEQLNAVEKRAKIENEVENATDKNHTQPQNDEDVFKLDFDSAVVEANKNNKKGEKMSFEKEEPKKNAKKQYTPEEQEEFQRKKAAFKALAEKVDTIKLREVFEMVGAHNNEDKIRNKWKMPWGDNVSLKGQQWYNHNGSTGGWGAVSFAKYAFATENHVDLKAEENQYTLYKAAVNMLAEYFGEQVDNEEIMAKVEDLKKEEKQGYLPPAKLSDDYLNKVIDYLHQERNLPLWVINKQIDSNKLYAGVPDWAVSKLNKAKINVENAPDNATYCIFSTKYTSECRCICDDTFENAFSPKGFASGSEKKLYGFTVVPDRKSEAPIVAVTEASIDAMSYHALYPDRFVISTGGADNFTLLSKLALESIENGWAFHLAYDNDNAGDHDYGNLVELLEKELGVEKVKELIDNNLFVRDVPPEEKDWNKYLQEHVQIEELDNLYTAYVEEGKKTKKSKKATNTAASLI